VVGLDVFFGMLHISLAPMSINAAKIARYLGNVPHMVFIGTPGLKKIK
jgi:hypothetical protein